MPNRIADEYHVVILEIFHRSLDWRIIALPDSGKFLLRTGEHAVVVFVVGCLRLYFKDVAIELRADLVCHTLRISAARSEQHEVTTITTGSGIGRF